MIKSVTKTIEGDERVDLYNGCRFFRSNKYCWHKCWHKLGGDFFLKAVSCVETEALERQYRVYKKRMNNLSKPATVVTPAYIKKAQANLKAINKLVEETNQLLKEQL